MLRSLLVALALTFLASASARAELPERPNIVIVFADDLGYGDLGCYGHPTIHTPHLDRLAAEGVRFTQFYSAAPFCSPSRAALLTGRLPIRSGMNVVLGPRSTGGIQDGEVTLAEALKDRGYSTACVGKWHLGHLPQYLPTRHGFDSYFGIPYSNDMNRTAQGEPGIPLMRNEEVVEQPAVQETLTRRYAEEAVRFIEEHRDGPFFLYLPQTFPHVPLFASNEFRGKSARGLYGDVVEELDWSVGQIRDSLERLGIAEKTIVFFSSDNGPWLVKRQEGGSAGLLREGKASNWEGGVRVPGIAWCPGAIPPAVCREPAGTMDLFATCIKLAGAEMPTDRDYDGLDLSGVLLAGEPSPRQIHFYYRAAKLQAVRKGRWKLHLMTSEPATGDYKAIPRDPPLLFDLETDPSEKYDLYDLAREHPEVVAELRDEISRHQAELRPGAPQT